MPSLRNNFNNKKSLGIKKNRATRISKPLRQRRFQNRKTLNLNVNSSKTLKVRGLHIFQRALRVSVVVLLTLFTLQGIRFALDKVFLKNPEFTLKNIEIQTDGELSERKILEILDIKKEGLHLLSFDLESAQKNILKIPEVLDVLITRHFPDRLSIQIFERLPVARLSCPKLGIAVGDLLLDKEGFVFDCEMPLEKHKSLPIIYIPNLSHIEGGKKTTSKNSQQALSLLSKLKKQEHPSSSKILKITSANEYSLEVAFQDGARITFGTEEIDLQLTHYKHILNHAQEQGRKIARLNLIPRKNIPIVYAHFKPSMKKVSKAPLPIRKKKAPHLSRKISANDVRDLLRERS